MLFLPTTVLNPETPDGERYVRSRLAAAPAAYAGEAAEAHADLALTRRYKPNEVSSIVQASEAELAAGMRKYHVVELHGTSNQLQDA